MMEYNNENTFFANSVSCLEGPGLIQYESFSGDLVLIVHNELGYSYTIVNLEELVECLGKLGGIDGIKQILKEYTYIMIDKEVEE